MRAKLPIIFGTIAVFVGLAVAFADSAPSRTDWTAETPRLTSADESIVCSRAGYLNYLRVGTLVGDLILDFSPYPDSVTDKQRIIDGLAATAPTGDATQVFASHFPTGEVFSTTCDASTCTLEEMTKPMNACLVAHWGECTESLIRFESVNYCLLEVTDEHGE